MAKPVFACELKNRQVRVAFDEEWQEYRCQLFVNGKLQKKATYHTDSFEDATGTARLMLEDKK